MNDRRKPSKPATRSPELIASIAKALSHPARVEIVALLRERESCIGCDIVDEVGLAQSTTSEHLRVLKAAGIIVGEIERPRVCYSLNPEALEPLQAFLGDLRGAPPTSVIPAASVTRAAASKRTGSSKKDA